MTEGGVLRRIVAALDSAGISSMLTGSFGSSYHGSPRATQDIDLVIETDERRLRAFVRSLPSDEYYVDESAAIEALHDETQFNVVDLMTGWKIDLIILKSRLFSREEFARRGVGEFGGTRLAIVTAEDLVVAKLEWAKMGASKRQIEDVAAILAIRGTGLDLAHVERWVETLDLRKEWEEARAV